MEETIQRKRAQLNIWVQEEQIQALKEIAPQEGFLNFRDMLREMIRAKIAKHQSSEKLEAK